MEVLVEVLPVWFPSVLLFLEKDRTIKEDKSVRRPEHERAREGEHL